MQQFSPACICSDADITALDEDSYTPLLIAAAHGQTDALTKLLDRGAPVDDLDKDGKSVVFVAAEENHTDVLQVRMVSSFQRVLCTGFNGRCVPIREVSSFQRVLCTGFNGVGT